MNKLIDAVYSLTAVSDKITNNNKNLILLEREIKWMSQEEIRKAKREGKNIVDSLDAILDYIKDFEIRNLNGEQLGNLMIDFCWVEHSCSQLVSVEPIDFLFGLDIGPRLAKDQSNLQILRGKIATIQDAYRKYLDHETGDKEDKMIPFLAPNLLNELPQLAKLIAPPSQLTSDRINSMAEELWEFFPEWILIHYQDLYFSKISNLSLERKINFLLKNKSLSLHYYSNRSFAKDMHLDESSLKTVNPKILKLQSQLLLQIIGQVRNEMESSPVLRVLYGINSYISLKENDIEQFNQFIEKNKNALALGTIGKRSKKRPEIIKIEALSHHLPRNLKYNKDNGNITIDLGAIGKGAFKKVMLKMDWKSSKMQAIGRTISRSFLQWLDDYINFRREISILQKLKGRSNVIQLEDVKSHRSKKGGFIHTLVMPYFNVGDLDSCMYGLTIMQKYRVAIDIIRGVFQVHEAGIIHNDIKPGNILIHLDEEGEIKAVIADFGVSFWMFDYLNRCLLRSACTPIYMAPELRASLFAFPNFKSDSWSLGKVLSELFPDYTLNLLVEPEDKQSVKYVIWSLLQKDPHARMSLQDALDIFVKQLENLS